MRVLSWLILILVPVLAHQALPGQSLVHSHVTPIESDDVYVAFFADGSVKTAVDQTQGIGRANGAIGLSLATRSYDINVLMNVASANQPVRSGFGTGLLVPAIGAGGGVTAALIDIRLPDAFTRLTGYREATTAPFLRRLAHADFHVYASLSSSQWAIEDSLLAVYADEPDLRTASGDSVVSVATAGIGVLAYVDFLHQEVQGNGISLGVEVGLAYRKLLGDIANREMADFKGATLGTASERFLGVETGIYLQVNRVKAGATYYYFPDEDVPGLSDGQVVVAISIQAEMFTAAARRRASRRSIREDVPRQIPSDPPAAPSDQSPPEQR